DPLQRALLDRYRVVVATGESASGRHGAQSIRVQRSRRVAEVVHRRRTTTHEGAAASTGTHLTLLINSKNCQRSGSNAQVTKGMVQEMRDKARELNVRPIRKVRCALPHRTISASASSH